MGELHEEIQTSLIRWRIHGGVTWREERMVEEVWSGLEEWSPLSLAGHFWIQIWMFKLHAWTLTSWPSSWVWTLTNCLNCILGLWQVDHLHEFGLWPIDFLQESAPWDLRIFKSQLLWWWGVQWGGKSWLQGGGDVSSRVGSKVVRWWSGAPEAWVASWEVFKCELIGLTGPTVDWPVLDYIYFEIKIFTWLVTPTIRTFEWVEVSLLTWCPHQFSQGGRNSTLSSDMFLLYPGRFVTGPLGWSRNLQIQDVLAIESDSVGSPYF